MFSNAVFEKSTLVVRYGFLVVRYTFPRQIRGRNGEITDEGRMVNEKNDALARIVFSFNNLSFSPLRGCVFQGNFGNNALLRFRAVEEG